MAARAVAFVCAGAVLAGCSSAPEPSASVDPTQAWVDEINTMLDGVGLGAQLSDETRDILERALVEGEVTSDMYREAADNAAACLEAAGLTPQFVAPTKEYGQWSISVQMFVPEGPDSPEMAAKTALSDGCLASNLDPVVAAYLDHPQVAAYQAGVFEQYRDALYECLIARGASIDHDATQSEYWQADLETMEMTPTGTCSMSTGFYDASVR